MATPTIVAVKVRIITSTSAHRCIAGIRRSPDSKQYERSGRAAPVILAEKRGCLCGCPREGCVQDRAAREVSTLRTGAWPVPVGGPADYLHIYACFWSADLLLRGGRRADGPLAGILAADQQSGSCGPPVNGQRQ